MPERGRERSGDEILRAYTPALCTVFNDHPGVADKAQGRPFGRRIGVAQAAAYGAAVANLNVRDTAHGVVQQRQPLANQRAGFEGAMPGHCAEDQRAVIRLPWLGLDERADAVEIDEQPGRGEPEPQRWNQALSAGNWPCGLATFIKQA